MIAPGFQLMFEILEEISTQGKEQFLQKRRKFGYIDCDSKIFFKC